MDYSLEAEIWAQAQEVFGHEAFSELLGQGVRSYRRLPGYSALQRLHGSLIGNQGLTTLRQVLRSSGLPFEEAASFVALRAGLRAHLNRYLSWQLIVRGDGSEPVLEGHLASDLGL